MEAPTGSTGKKLRSLARRAPGVVDLDCTWHAEKTGGMQNRT
jgi:hypothetical protein